MYQKKGKKINYVIDDKEYYEFLSKFRGCLLFRGKSSLSFKLLDNIFFYFKKTFGLEPDYLFKRSIAELMPFLSYRNIRLGKKYYPVPFVLKKHRRFMLLID
jgi:ribosomal protein S7